MLIKQEIEKIVSQKGLFLNYVYLVKLGSILLSPPIRDCIIDLKENYEVVIINGVKAVTHKSDAQQISLENVLFGGLTPEEGMSGYDINMPVVFEDDGKIKIEGRLERKIDFLCSGFGKDYSGLFFSGYVVEEIKEQRKIIFPDFEF